ncbi:enoyl-CoA hydratase/isomerase family protein [Pararhodonellum marinum]|uniref:enoyl-CoA hydratase/isomerase family protein n=1 Tax=Pararhodonellum marinum TaxID=2755358 RepID=UPI00188E6EF5|nr:enoyl-CoA hydratase/isomerase family protein [Pararhodonellum marinum]
MNFETIIYTKNTSWAKVSLNRPEVYNALNKTLLEELLAAFREVENDENIRCVVLTGEGKAFSSGQDLKAVGGDIKNVPFDDIIRNQYNPLITQMRTMKKVIICQLNGVAAGAGCSLALASDIIVASHEAYLAEIFINIALIMDAGSTYFLPRALGAYKAFEIATTGRKIYGEEAERLGLANKSVPASDLENAVMEFVHYYQNAPSKAVGLIKEMLNRSGGMVLAEVLEMEALYQKEAGSSSDFAEGVMAFLQKRKPDFKGK